MGTFKDEAVQYIAASKYAILATVGKDQTPNLRVVGGYGNDGVDFYFSTSRSSKKFSEIKANPNVTVFFQNEGQDIKTWSNVSVSGVATEVADQDDIRKSIEIIAVRYPNIKNREIASFTQDSVLLHVKAQKIKSFDFSRQPSTEEEAV